MFDIRCPREAASRACGVLLMAILALALGTPAHAATVCRVTAGGISSGSGTWASPMTLQSALANTACHEIWVKAGTYKPTAGTNRSISFNIRPGVAVYGGFASGETQRDQRRPKLRITTLSGDIGQANSISDNSYHVVYMNGTTGAGIIDNSTVLDGFTISGGNAGGNEFPNYNGGGLFCDGEGSGNKCSPSLSQLVFDTNRAGWVGGAMHNEASNGGVSSPVLTNVAFIHNTAVEYGGAIYNEGYQGNSSPRLVNVSFDGNSSDYSGGAMYNGGGGSSGISSPILSNVTFSNNHAVDDGGAMDNDGYDGGASKPVLNNVTFSGNSARRGGAMFNDADSGTSSPVLSNVILWGNTATNSGPEMVNYLGATVSISHSAIAGGCASISGAMCGSGNTAGDPRLGALADNGGLTPTMLPGAGSSAIDAGSTTTCANAYVNNLDQRGVIRPQGSGCDMGSVEVEVMGDIIFVDGFDSASP